MIAIKISMYKYKHHIMIFSKMLTILKYGHKVTKPRARTTNTANLEAYRKELHEARVRSHKQSVRYLNKIEDEFLEEHRKKTAEEHFNNQCKFRSKIARNSFIFFEELEKNKAKHEEKLQQIDKYIRGEEIKRLNRDRVRKILEYESSNFWLNGETVTEKFISDRVLPEFVGSTEYYHKLHTEAFAYEDLDFSLLHKLSSNEQSVKYKNQLLIPLFKQVLYLMRMVKFTDQQRENKLYFQSQIKTKKRYSSSDPQKLKQQLQKLQGEYQSKIYQIKQQQTNPQSRREYFKSKLTDLILLLKKWKEYTDILGMTSAQVLLIIQSAKKQATISERKAVLEKDIERKRDRTFVDVAEEDTEDEEFTLQSFLNIKAEAPSPTQTIDVEDFNAQLASLLQKQKSIFEQITNQLAQKESQSQKQTSSLSNPFEQFQMPKQSEQNIKIDEGYLKPSQTTTSIQVLKEQYKNDKNLQKLLNIAGELTVQYPKLFSKIWDNQIL